MSRSKRKWRRKMDRFLLLHGWGGSDYPHWQAWLAAELAKEYGTVSFPLIHHPHHPNKKRWMAQFRKHLQEFRPTTVICHSLACTVWFALCEEGIEEVERLLLVAPPLAPYQYRIAQTLFSSPAAKKPRSQRGDDGGLD